MFHDIFCVSRIFTQSIVIMTSYPHYKPSLIAWLGDIPEHWEVKRVKDIFDLIRGKFTHRPRNDEKMFENGCYPFIQTGDVARATKYVLDYKQLLNEEGIKVSRKFKKGTLLMTISANIGDVALLGFDAYFPDSLIAFETKHCIDYFFYLLTSTKSALDTVKITNTQDNLNLERLNGLLKPLPPLSEQAAIATYLDRKTQAIDKKIELLNQKITHYQHLRKTLINETVCRGLDKNVPLKDSGISWIGKIPEHWEVKRVKEIGKVVLGKMLNTTPQTGYYLKPYLKSKNIGWLQVNTDSVEEMYFNTAEMKQYRVKKGDLLLSEGGEVGKTCIWEGELPECYIQNSVHKITVFKNHNSRFYLYLSFYLGTSKSYDSIVNQVSIKHLTWEKLNNIIWVVPPLPEQLAIAQYLDQQTQQIDHIVKNLQKQIELLRELRKTLINEVVTGKVRVVDL